MSFHSITTELNKIFQTEIADVDNIAYRVGNDGRDNPNEDLWCVLGAVESGFERQSFNIPFNVYQDDGIYTIQIFTTLGSGTKTVNELAEKIRDVYNDRYVRVTGIDIRLEYPDIVVIGRVENYYQVNINVDFTALVEKTK